MRRVYNLLAAKLDTKHHSKNDVVEIELQELNADGSIKLPCSLSTAHQSVLQNNFFPSLDLNSAHSLSQVNRRLSGFFTECLTNYRLLEHVLHGEQKEAHAWLTKLKRANPETFWHAILQNSHGVEYCGRVWHAVSPLAYAVWSGDAFMMKMLTSFIPAEKLQLAIDQINFVCSYGTECGDNLSAFKPLQQAFKGVTSCMQWDELQLKRHIINVIGRAQRELPINMLQEICSQSFVVRGGTNDGALDFSKEPKRTLLFQNKHSLFNQNFSSALGVNFALSMIHNSFIPAKSINNVTRQDKARLAYFALADARVVIKFLVARILTMRNHIFELKECLQKVHSSPSIQRIR